MQDWASVARSVANRIESMIENGELEEGAQLPSQRHLSGDALCFGSLKIICKMGGGPEVELYLRYDCRNSDNLMLVGAAHA
jgi:hypothetical protein